LYGESIGAFSISFRKIELVSDLASCHSFIVVLLGAGGSGSQKQCRRGKQKNAIPLLLAWLLIFEDTGGASVVLYESQQVPNPAS
jgi:hypothetical protein